MKNILKSFLLIVALLTIGAGVEYSVAQQRSDALTITNYVSEKYRDFPLTKVSIIPPDGFVSDSDSFGFTNKAHNASLVVDDHRENVLMAANEFIKMFNDSDHTDTLHRKLIESYWCKINGFDGFLAGLSNPDSPDRISQWWMFIGDHGGSYVIRGILPEKGDEEISKQIRNALITVFYEPDRRLVAPGADPTTTGTSACRCHQKQ